VSEHGSKAATTTGVPAGETRRDFIHIAAATVAAGGVAAVAWPFVQQLAPAADTRALSAADVDVSKVPLGSEIRVLIGGQPFFIRHRTSPREIASAKAGDTAQLRDPATDDDAEEPQLLVDVRRHPRLHAGCADRHRHRAGDALHAACRHGLRLGRAHHARRERRLADALHARQRRVDVLHRRLHPHLPRPLLRLLQGAARGALDPRRRDLPADDGDGLHGLRAALGPDELLGRHRHHQPVLGAIPWSASRS
jgi:Rieske Fe-S protein